MPWCVIQKRALKQVEPLRSVDYNNKNYNQISRDLRPLVKKVAGWKGIKGRQKDRAERARLEWTEVCGWWAGRSRGPVFQSGTGLDESVYSATVSDIPFSCPKKSPLKSCSAGE